MGGVGEVALEEIKVGLEERRRDEDGRRVAEG